MESSDTGGVKAFPIAGRYVNERERLLGMTDAERAYRNQWLKDQILTDREPVYVPENDRELVNPIRRFYRFPLDKMCDALTPSLGHYKAFTIRFWTGKALMTLGLTYGIYYYFKYGANNWTKKGGWRIYKSRKAVLPGDPGYPKVSDRTKPSDYNVRGFDKSPI